MLAFRGWKGGQEAVLEAKLFGIAELHLNGQRVHPPTRKAFGLIALLLLDGEVSRDRMAGLLWGQVHPERARRNLRQELYRLASSPLGASLELVRDSLRLILGFTTDVAQFRIAVSEGRFADALALHRGSLLESISIPNASGFAEWLERERNTLALEHRAALLGLAAALAKDGAHREALSAYLECLADDELQEDLHREVMRLHSLLGERSAALMQFERLKRVLRRQVGLEPLPETIALVDDIRAKRTSAEFSAISATPSDAQSVCAPFVGRAAALQTLKASTETVALLTGEPGIGKTRLALEFTGDNQFVLRGREQFGSLGLHCVAAAVRDALQRGSSLEGLPLIWRAELARLLPEVATSSASDPKTSNVFEGRARFLHGLAQVLSHLTSPAGTVILDDLHWFDPSSLEVVAQLEELLRADGRRIIVTARDAELSGNAAATRWLNALERDGQLSRLPVAGLATCDLRELGRSLTGTDPADELVSRLQRATAGNALYALETWRELRDKGTLNAAQPLPIPTGVWSAVKSRVDRLGAAVRRVLEAASLLADGVTLELVSASSALGDWAALEALEAASTAGLLTETHGVYRFSHDLVREALERDLGETRLRLLHRRLAGVMAAQAAANSAIVAHHFEQGGLPQRGLAFRLRAAEDATRLFAYREALLHYEAALRGGASEVEQFSIRQHRAQLFEYIDDLSGWSLEVDALETLALRLRHAAFGLQAKLERARNEFARADFAAALQTSDHVLKESQNEKPVHLTALVESAKALQRLGRLAESRQRLELAQRQLEPNAFALEAEIEELLTAVAFNERDWATTQAHNEAALRAAVRAGAETREVVALNNRARLAERQADPAASALFERAYIRAAQTKIVGLQRTVLLGWSGTLINAGQFAEAATKIELGLALTQEPQNPRLRARFLANLSVIRGAQGLLGESLAAQLEAIAVFDEIGETFHATHGRINLADLLADLGDTAGARAMLERAIDTLHTSGFVGLQAWCEAILVRCDLVDRRIPRLQRLKRSLKSEVKTDEFARRYALCILAEARLFSGDAAEALEIVAGLDAPPAIHAVALSVRIAAQVALQRQSPSSLETALALLGSSEISHGSKLHLFVATVSALESQGAKKRALELRKAATQLMRHLGDSLEPVRRSAFSAYWTRRLAVSADAAAAGKR